MIRLTDEQFAVLKKRLRDLRFIQGRLVRAGLSEQADIVREARDKLTETAIRAGHFQEL